MSEYCNILSMEKSLVKIEKLEYRFVINYFRLKGMSPLEILQNMIKASQEDTLSYVFL